MIQPADGASCAVSRGKLADVSRGGALRPGEIANAAVFGALAVVIVSVAALLPHLGALAALSIIPLAIVGLRNRVRALVAASVAGAFVAFLVGGPSAAFALAAGTVLGGLCGVLRRRGRRMGTIALVSAALAPLAAAGAVGVLLLFSAARELAFGSLRATIAGFATALDAMRMDPAIGPQILRTVDTLLGAWPLVVAVVVLIGVPVGMLVTNALVVVVARRVEWMSDDDVLDGAARADGMRDLPVAPLPMTLSGVGLRYPGAAVDALDDVDLAIRPGEFVVIMGANGSGKSTLVSILAGAEPTRGRVERAGRVGLGRTGGTALVQQRPETQVIGATVEQELRWGLDEPDALDVDAALAAVGLSGSADAVTDTLSGGQLQRLSIATALARRPALLISDESTSMLDAQGRAEVLDLLASLPARTGCAVVHVTHDPVEARRADRVIGLVRGRVTDPALAMSTRRNEASAAEADADREGMPLLDVRGVAHRFYPGTPWEVTALRSVDLEIRRGDGVLITGENGSGKSTLAWLLAGLIAPTAGSLTLAGAPVSTRVGDVALSFQHARLQLQRPTVAEDILAAAHAGFDRHERQAFWPPVDPVAFVSDRLREVGLPAHLADRPVDRLSGGQMRRVAIAGLLASRPEVLVLDEPLAGLDRDARFDLLQLLGRLRRERGLTLIIVSHDLEDTELACSRTIRVDAGVASEADGDLPNGRVDRMPRSGPAATQRRRRGGLVLRPIPGDSPIHRLGAAVKYVALTALTIGVILVPGWPTIAALAVFVAVVIGLARIPAGVIPRVSWWVVGIFVVSAVASFLGGGIMLFLQATALTVLLLTLSLVVVWTTSVESLPRAFRTLARPLRALRAPVDEWAHTLTLAIRTLPQLQDEFRVLVAARRLRRPAPSGGPLARMRSRARGAVDLLVGAVAAAGRRSSDLGRAMTVRGGIRIAPGQGRYGTHGRG